MNTTETNKKFAEFLGRDKIEMLSRYIVDDSWLTDEMTDTYKFNSDWNWLMLVVGKIKESCWMDILIGTSTTVEIGEYEQQEPNIASHNAKEMVEAVYNACSMFVDWWNNKP